MKLTDVIRRPLITEKTSLLREDGRTIVFQVATGANKIQIRHAVEQLLGAKVASIPICPPIANAASNIASVPSIWLRGSAVSRVHPNTMFLVVRPSISV